MSEYNFIRENTDLVVLSESEKIDKDDVRDIVIKRYEGTSYGGDKPKKYVSYQVYAQLHDYPDADTDYIIIEHQLREFHNDYRDAQKYKQSILESLLGHGGWIFDTDTMQIVCDNLELNNKIDIDAEVDDVRKEIDDFPF